jgi:hypothetical protein
VLVEFFQQLRKDHSIPGRAHWFFGPLAILVVFILQPGEISLLQAQVTAAIQGVVTDQQGLPIAGAEIVVRADAVGVEIKTTTAADGSFGVVGLQPGAYTVSASHEGFVTKSYADLLLAVNSQLRAMITLVVGSMEQASSTYTPLCPYCFGRWWAFACLARASTAWFKTWQITSLGIPWRSNRFMPEAISMYESLIT